MTYIRNNIPFDSVAINTDLQAVAIRIKTPIECTLCNLYLTDAYWREEDLRDLFRHLPQPAIVIGLILSKVKSGYKDHKYGELCRNLILDKPLLREEIVRALINGELENFIFLIENEDKDTLKCLLEALSATPQEKKEFNKEILMPTMGCRDRIMKIHLELGWKTSSTIIIRLY